MAGFMVALKQELLLIEIVSRHCIPDMLPEVDMHIIHAVQDVCSVVFWCGRVVSLIEYDLLEVATAGDHSI